MVLRIIKTFYYPLLSYVSAKVVLFPLVIACRFMQIYVKLSRILLCLFNREYNFMQNPNFDPGAILKNSPDSAWFRGKFLLDLIRQL